jgi:putative oxidoreductase
MNAYESDKHVFIRRVNMQGLSTFSIKAIRYIVGYVFVLVGVLKWLMDEYGLTRFENIGIPYPEVSVLIVGSVEIIFGSLILFNLYVRKATIPLLFVMVGAITLTKIPILIESGLWRSAFEARLDVVMTALLIILWKEHKDN